MKLADFSKCFPQLKKPSETFNYLKNKSKSYKIEESDFDSILFDFHLQLADNPKHMDNPDAYLKRSIKNKLIDFNEKEKKERNLFDDLNEEIKSEDSDYEIDKKTLEEKFEKLVRLIDPSLTKSQMEDLKIIIEEAKNSFGEDINLKELAVILGIEYNTLQKKISRIKERISPNSMRGMMSFTVPKRNRWTIKNINIPFDLQNYSITQKQFKNKQEVYFYKKYILNLELFIKNEFYSWAYDDTNEISFAELLKKILEEPDFAHIDNQIKIEILIHLMNIDFEIDVREVMSAAIDMIIKNNFTNNNDNYAN
jgi:DNA-directed RNA polymerase specialized sigma24 family protein